MAARVWPDEEPGLLGLLPLVYVAWSDLELDPGEIDSIRSMAGCDDPDSAVCRALGTWLDPESPPTLDELAEVRRWLQQPAEPAATPSSTLRQLEGAIGVTADQILKGEGVKEPHVYAWPAPPLTEPGFSVAALGDLLDGPYPEERVRVRAWLEGKAHRYDLPVAQQRAHTLGMLEELAATGFADAAYPSVTTDHDTMGPFFARFETLAAFDLGLWVKVGVQFGLFGGSLYFLGTDRHHAMLADVASARTLGCFAMSETGHGSNVRELATRATYLPDVQAFELHTPSPGDRKDWVGNAAEDGRFATVFAQLAVGGVEHGVHAFLVRIRDDEGRAAPGITLTDSGVKMGLNGVDNGRLSFDRVQVPRDALLDRFGSVSAEGEYTSPIASPSRRFFTMIGTLVGGRVGVANAALTAAKVSLTIAVRYAARRRQFGPPGGTEVPILSYPTHRRRLMPLLASAVVLDLALEDLTSRYEAVARSDEDKRELEALAAGLKAMSTWNTTHTVQQCREACGGAGYLAVNRFAALKADSDVFTTFEGDNTVLLQLVAKGLLTGFRQQFTDDRVYGMVRFLAGRAGSALQRLNPFEGRATSSERLRSSDLQLELLHHRAEDLVVGVATRMRRLLQEGVDGFEAFNRCQLAAVDLARAHLEHHIVECCVKAEEGLEDPALADVVAKLRSLYALKRIASERGWYMAHGYMGAPQALAIGNEVEALYDEVAAEALGIVEAFRLPSSCVDAPIARLDAQA